MMELLRETIFFLSKFFHSKKESVYRKDFDSCAGTYDSVKTRGILGAETEELISRIEIEPGTVCIDLGCGTGHSTLLMNQRLKWKGEIHACDNSHEMIKAASEKIGSKKNIFFHEMDSLGFLKSLPEGHADFIGAFWSLEYSDHSRLLKEAGRVLKPGGKIAILANTRNSLDELQKLITPIVIKNIFSLKTIPPLNMLKNIDSFRKLSEKVGLKTTELSEGSESCSFSSGDELVEWMKNGGPAAGFRSSLREKYVEKIFSLIKKEADRRNGLDITFRFIKYIGEK